MKLEKPISSLFLIRFLTLLVVLLTLLAGFYEVNWSVTQQKLNTLEYQVNVNGL